MNKRIIYGIIGLALILVIVIILVLFNEHVKIQRRTIPVPPSSLEIAFKTSNEILLTWIDEAMNETGYRIYRDGKEIATRPKDTESFTDYDVEPSTEYEYTVVAYNINGESRLSVIKTKSKNPPLTVRINKIGVRDNGEDGLRDWVDNHGEVYLGVIVGDGMTIRTRRLPASGFYFYKDNSSRDFNELIFSTASVGEHLEIYIIGIEHDYSGLGDDLLIEALNYAILHSLGTIPSLICTVARVDLKTPIEEIGGFRDEFLGEYNEYWGASDNWGVRKEPYFIECDKGNGQIGLQIWFTIESPLLP